MLATLRLTLLALCFSALARCSPVPGPADPLGGLVSTLTGVGPPGVIDASALTHPLPFGKNTASCFQAPDSPKNFHNDLSPDAACKNVTIIFARGTSEPGNVGQEVGPCFFAAVEQMRPGQVAIQGINNYKANVPDFLQGGSKAGAGDINASIDLARQKCPETNVVVAGYSQGAQIVHRAADEAPSGTWKDVKAVVMFGDPRKGDTLPGVDSAKVKTVCHDGDEICERTVFILPPHLTYGDDAADAAAFVDSMLPPRA